MASSRGPAFALSIGASVGAVISLLILASTLPTSTGYHWPTAAQVEDAGAYFTPGISGGLASEAVGNNCTTMLADVNSNVSIEVWVTPWNTAVNPGTPEPPASYYYWSGLAGLKNLSTILTITDPSGGVALSLYDATENQSGSAQFGYVFEQPDC